MRYRPHTIYMMALRGRKTIHGRPLPTPAQAAQSLARLTGQDFGDDADKWMTWIKANRKGLYKR